MCNCKEDCKSLFNVLAAIFSLFLVVLIAAKVVDIQNKVRETGNTMTFSGTGTIYVKPDLVLTTFSVITDATTVADTLSQNTQKMNAVINFVKGQGVDEKDLKTTNFSIYPRYEWYEAWQCYPPCPGGKRVLAGYEVTQSLQVKIRDMTKIGQILEGAAAAGANEIGDLQFTLDKEEDLKTEARAEAINTAKEKAKELTGQLGVKLGRIVNFSENGIFPVPFYYEAGKATGMGGGETPQIETGENKIEVTVSITYEIN